MTDNGQPSPDTSSGKHSHRGPNGELLSSLHFIFLKNRGKACRNALQGETDPLFHKLLVLFEHAHKYFPCAC